jgi:hypothetical protein
LESSERKVIRHAALTNVQLKMANSFYWNFLALHQRLRQISVPKFRPEAIPYLRPYALRTVNGHANPKDCRVMIVGINSTTTAPYPTAKKGDLTKVQRNPEVFRAVLDYVRPSVILVRGNKSTKELIAVLKPTNPVNRKGLETLISCRRQIQVICARHLSRVSDTKLAAIRAELLRLSKASATSVLKMANSFDWNLFALHQRLRQIAVRNFQPEEIPYLRPYALRTVTGRANLKNCRVMIVGINPTTPVPYVFWGNIREDQSFDVNAYEAAILAARNGKGYGRARQRIAKLLEGLNVASANVYSYPTAKQGTLTKAQRNPEMFRAVLDYVRPSVILVHGNKSIRELIAVLKPTNPVNHKGLSTWTTCRRQIQVICSTHLSRVSNIQLVAIRAQLLRLST